MPLYTVKSSMPTGKEDPKFGVEYYIQFNEMSDAPALWFKKQPVVDQEMELEQVNGKWKKVKKEWNPNAATATTQDKQVAPSTGKPAWKDNSDGMRQGMCINNAANFVNNQVFGDQVLTDVEWAIAVHKYATELYRLGDLTPAPASTVAQIFGSEPTAVSANG